MSSGLFDPFNNKKSAEQLLRHECKEMGLLLDQALREVRQAVSEDQQFQVGAVR